MNLIIEIHISSQNEICLIQKTKKNKKNRKYVLKIKSFKSSLFRVDLTVSERCELFPL